MINTTPVNASVFSLMEGLFNKKVLANSDDSALNSQNMPLLQAFSVLNLKDALGGGDTIIDANALVADVGPLGTSLDLEIPTSDQISVYVVRPGDSLSQIADMFEVSVNTIRWANDLARGDTLKEGQVLVILPISGVRYMVKKGDTLAGIARAFKGDKEEIAQFNDLDSDGELVVGEQIIIPHGEIVPTPSPINNQSGKKVVTGNNRVDSTGYFIRPIRGGIRTQGVHGYNGVDLASYYGAEIFSAANGVAIVAKEGGWNGGYGSYVVIRHNNGTQTLYAHLSEVMIGQGQEVVQGQVIGLMGSSGRSTGTHLHFEVRGSANPF